ncbi:hypothetical protein CBS101457_006296 [Exobasidium rhododendri]|nr:hypothetical protein CBS101457_006296 [Exobasidium rhododendri]
MAPRAVTLPREVCDALGLTAEESAFREGSATIVLPSKDTAFLNPVQEFNRDLSTLAIRTWSDIRNEEKKERYMAALERKASMKSKRGAKENGRKSNKRQKANEIGEGESADHEESEKVEEEVDAQEGGDENETTKVNNTYRDYRFTLLEALSATGLRSIRYAREIPLLKTVLANDLSSSAVDAMRRNVALNFPAGKRIEEWNPVKENDKAVATSQPSEDAIADLENSSVVGDSGAPKSTEAVPITSQPISGPTSQHINDSPKLEIHPKCKVKINEGDAMSLMYSHRDEKKRFDVVDLDPYGSASVFLDGAVQSVADGGLLCVTCTDSAVLAGTSYPEKTFSAYGGVTTRVEYSHEIGLRLLLNAISTSASRYGRFVEPMLSLSIDFYIRVFVRIYTKPIEVKRVASRTGAVLTCTSCQSAVEMRFGRHSEHQTKDGRTLDKYHGGTGPSVGTFCDECGGKYLLAGPMWLGRLHDRNFCRIMIETANREPERFKTIARINGMVGVANEELEDVPFYLTPSRISSFFRCNSPPLLVVVSALLHAGHQVSRSHCVAGSIKTSASRKELYDIWRCWIRKNPVKMEGISPNSPAIRLLNKPIEKEYNLTDEHENAKSLIEGSGRGTRYQMNPLPNWGPGTAAKSTTRSAEATKEQPLK